MVNVIHHVLEEGMEPEAHFSQPKYIPVYSYNNGVISLIGF